MIGGIVEVIACPHCEREQQVRIGIPFTGKRSGEKWVVCNHPERGCGEPFVVNWSLEVKAEVRGEV